MKANCAKRAGERMLILQAVAAYIRQHKQPPLVKDIYVATTIGTIQAVSDHVKALVAEGLLERTPGKQRSIRPTMEGEYALRRWQNGEKAIETAHARPRRKITDIYFNRETAAIVRGSGVEVRCYYRLTHHQFMRLLRIWKQTPERIVTDSGNFDIQPAGRKERVA